MKKRKRKKEEERDVKWNVFETGRRRKKEAETVRGELKSRCP